MLTYPRPSTCRSMQVRSSVTAPQESMNLSMARAVNPDSRSTRRTVSTARPATSRTRPRISTGSLPKAAEAPIIRTCKWLAGVALASLAFTPALARVTLSDPARDYVQARVAEMNGNHAEAAQLLASLAAAEPGKIDLTKKALEEALSAGQMDLALRLARTIPPEKLSTDARLPLAADEIRRGHAERAQPWLTVRGATGDLSFLVPLVNAWTSAERGDSSRALASLDQVPARGLLAPIMDEQHALILLKLKRTADAEPFARRAVGNAGAREDRLRLAFADGFLAAGDRARALMIIDGMGEGEAAARQRIMAGRMSGEAIDSLPEALGEVLAYFAADLTRMQQSAPPVALVQVARYLDPANSRTTALLALLIADQQRTDEA